MRAISTTRKFNPCKKWMAGTPHHLPSPRSRRAAMPAGHDSPAHKVLAEAAEEPDEYFVKASLKRSATAEWRGSLKEGADTMTVQSGALRGMQYFSRTRFADGKGTNPDELIAAPLGGCFSMSLRRRKTISSPKPSPPKPTARWPGSSTPRSQ